MQARKLLNIVEAIGATTDIEQARLLTLKMLREVIWFDRGLFWLYDPCTGLPTGLPVSLDMPDQITGGYPNYQENDEVRMAYRSSRRVSLRSTDLFDYPRWTQHSSFYNDLLKPHDLHYMSGFDIKDRQSNMGALCITRGRKTGNFSQHDVENLTLVYPHLQNRLRWNKVLDASVLQLNTGVTLANEKTSMGEPLTRREHDIASLVMSGASNQEIASLLGISLNTVKMHLQNIFEKLHIKRRSQLFLVLQRNEKSS
ncbi:MAG TPA: helix-turn-helix transcriptional regulator [Syntrophomonadaceae bacterium]|nr:helix-turn-helix transcriptional regulator [Syntrophomonadaceae bacterium]